MVSNSTYLKILCIIFTLFTTKVFAHHYAGAEFTYTCINSTTDSSTYQVELTIYRDCASGIPFLSYYTAFYESPTCTPASQPQTPITLLPITGEVEITRLCPGEYSNCSDPLSDIIGIKKRTYAAVVKIPRCSDWYFWWRDQSRNNQNLSNVDGGSEQDMFVDMNFDNTSANCNNSCTYSDSALITKFFCVGSQYTYSLMNDITNPDGDSISFHLVNPLQGPGLPITYAGGFTYLNPISTQNGFNLNSATGILTFTPTAAEESIISIEIREYRNGVLIGKSVRDMQIFTRACTNTPPDITGVNGTDEDTVYMCINTDQYIYVIGSDVDSGQIPTVTVLNNNLPPNAQVYDTATGPNSNGQVIIWSPDTSQGGTYTITFEVDDQACPNSQSNQRTIYFIVDTTLNAQCNCSRASFESFSGCMDDTTFFQNSSFSVGGNIVSWLWNFDDPGSGADSISTLEEPSHVFSTFGLFHVSLTWTDDQGCSQTFIKEVVICDTPRTQIKLLDNEWCEAPGRTCYEARCDGSPYCNVAFSWDVSHDSTVLNSYLMNPPSSKWFCVEYSEPGYHSVSVTTTLFAGLYNPEHQYSVCTNGEPFTDTFYIHPKPDLTLFDSSFYQSCTPAYDTFFVATSTDTVLYQWYVNGDPIPEPEGTNDTLFTSTVDLTLSPDEFNDIEYMIRVTDTTTGCYNDTTLTVFDPIQPNFYVSPYCAPGDSVIFIDTSSYTMYYDFITRLWNFGDGNPSPPLDTSNYVMHYYNYFDTTFYPTLYVLDSDSCYDIATSPIVRIALPDSNIQIIGGDSDEVICYYERNLTFIGPNEGNALIGKWVWEIDDTNRVDSIVVVLNDSSISNNDKYLHSYYKGGVAFLDSLKRPTPHFSRTYLAADTGWQHICVSIRFNYSYDSYGERIESHYCEAGPYCDSINLRPEQVGEIYGGGECLNDSFEFKGVQLSGDPLVSWFWDFNDSYGGTDYNDYDTLTQAATPNDSITTATYKYTPYETPDFGRRYIKLTFNDIYGCETQVDFKRDTAVAMAPQDFFWDNNCSDNSIELTPTSANPNCNNCWENISLFEWDFGVVNLTTDTASQVAYGEPVYYTYDSSGIYDITLTYSHPAGGHNCKDTVIKQMVVQPAPSIDITVQDPVCFGKPTIFLDHTQQYLTYEYDSTTNTYTGELLPTSITERVFTLEDSLIYYTIDDDSMFLYTFQSAGYHDSILVQLESSNGCVATQYLSTYVAKTPDAWYYLEDIPIANQPIVFLDSTDWMGEPIHQEISHNWLAFDSLSNLIFADSGYSLTSTSYETNSEALFNMMLIVTNESGCKDTIVREIDTYVYLDFPTAFSPTEGGDVKNNIFRLHYKGITEVSFYKIYNRYGEVVFDGGNDKDAIWDGKFKSRLQEMGSYICIVTATDIFGRTHHLKKNVLLVR